MVVAASLVFLGSAVAAGQDVLADYDDNGTIDRCYTDAEFEEALELIAARPDLQQYAAAGSLIQEKAAECSRDTIVAGEAPPVEEDEGSTALWLVIGALVAAAIAAALVVAVRRRGSTPGT